MFKIFIGYDSREDFAYQVCKNSILSHISSSEVVEIIPLKLQELRQNGFYWRDEDKLSSTEFTFSRFLVPSLSNYEGVSLFIDCDTLFLEDPLKLFDLFNPEYAIQVVKHDYKPLSKFKMDGRVQTQYPRKNWSSVILWNNKHLYNKQLTVNYVNKESGAHLHRFNWIPDNYIGELPYEWNWLTDWYSEGDPKLLHFTEGGPWFENYRDCKYSNLWVKEVNKMFSG